MTLAGAALMSTGLITTAIEPNIFSVNSNVETVQAAAKRFRIKLRHNSAYYNVRGKRIGRKYRKKSATLIAYGIRTIKHRRYYNIGRGRYIKAANAYRVVNKKSFRRLKNGNYEFRILIRSAVYNNKGRHLNLNYINKGTYVYGKRIVTIKGMQFVDIGYGQYIKRANTRTFFIRGHAPTGHNGGIVVNPSHRGSTTHKGGTKPTKPKNNHHSTAPTKPSKPNTGNSGNNKHKTGDIRIDNQGHRYMVVDGTRNYLDNNQQHVKELVIQKLNAIRAHTSNSVGSNPAFALRPYKTNSEIQAVADMRANEATLVFSHTRPNGERMDAKEYEKLLPKTDRQWCTPGYEDLGSDADIFGEALGGVNAQQTDEDTANAIIDTFFSDSAHKNILISDGAPYAYAAVGLHFDQKRGYAVAFEMIGASRAPFTNNPWK